MDRGKRLAGYVPDYTVFDLETTGVSCSRDEIIEISAVKVKKGEIADTYSTLVNPGRAIPFQATAVNGITDEMVSGAPYLEEALDGFLKFIGDSVLVGHNIQSFDMKLIYQASERIFGRTVPNDFIDTLYMARRCLPELGHHRLTDLAQHFGISSAGAHRALNDCIMNQRCFEEMAKLQEAEAVPVCPKCGGELIRRKGRYGEFYGCGNFPRCRYTQNIS